MEVIPMLMRSTGRRRNTVAGGDLEADVAQFSAHMKRDGTTSTLAVSGEVDLSNSEKVSELGRLAVDALSDSDRVLIIDLSDVAFMDSTGLSALVVINNAALLRGSEVRLRGMQPLVRRVLELGELAAAFQHDDVGAAAR
jgi:anti-sigma B factor antagonist